MTAISQLRDRVLNARQILAVFPVIRFTLLVDAQLGYK